jgi:carboxypeptidase Taq
VSVATDASPLERLRVILAELADLRHTESVLDWDARVSMPPAGAEARAQVAATVTTLMHERFVSEEVGDLLEALDGAGDDDDAALVRVTRREWDRARRVPSGLAGEIAHAAGIGVAAWDRAKAASDFDSFVPHLERQLELKHRYIECFPATDAPYDVLLDDYEEGMTTADAQRIFDRLKEELVPLVEQHADRDVPILRGPFPVAQQQRASRLVLDAFGYDETSWRIDETPHPFAAKPGLGDIRLTTHTDEGDLTA